MSYRKDQGRYARMLAFWALLLLFAFGCFHGGGLCDLLDRWMTDNNKILIDPFPILKTLRVSTCIALGVLAISGFGVHSILNRPRIADALIDTEAEMQKVTWPAWGEAWQGTVAVTIMVIVLFVFLTAADLLLVNVISLLVPAGGS